MEIRLPAGDRTGDGVRTERPIRRVPEYLGLPADVLVRHRARLLDPSTAVVGPSGQRVESTVYRADTLLIPLRQALQPDVISRYNKTLEPLGFELKVVIPETRAWQQAIDHLSPDLQVPILLLARSDRLSDRAPDPWAALVALRRSYAQEDVEVIELEHVVAAAAVEVGGTPFGNGSVASPFGNGSTGAPFGNGGINAGISLATGTRNPVRIFVPEPARRAASELPAGRRPVVAVLDTGIGVHPWLTVGPVADDPVVEVSQEFQTLVDDQEAAIAAASGAQEPPSLASPWEQRDVIQPLLGLTDSVAGHGTFVSGLVFQNCPDARILSLRVLHTDGIGSDASVLLALDWLYRRQRDALANDRRDELVDVVSVSLGFYPEATSQVTSTQLAQAVRRLTDLGVAVVAAAGNDATSRPFVPAALALDPNGTNKGNELLVAVGALNASGRTTAAFTNDGEWVTCWAPGNAVISTVPLWQGAEGPDIVVASGNGRRKVRTAPDGDDLRTGFAVWAGTSFATPVVAGMLAGHLAGLADGMDEAGRRQRVLDALVATRAQLDANGWHN